MVTERALIVCQSALGLKTCTSTPSAVKCESKVSITNVIRMNKVKLTKRVTETQASSASSFLRTMGSRIAASGTL